MKGKEDVGGVFLVQKSASAKDHRQESAWHVAAGEATWLERTRTRLDSREWPGHVAH